MAITPKLEIRQSQSLLMTPQLRQAINLLQLSNLELSELVEQELNNNPLLEREEDRLADAEIITPPTIDDFPDSHAESLPETQAAADIDYDTQFDDDFASDRQGYETAEWPRHQSADFGDDFDFIEKKIAGTPSLYTLLDQQITLNFSTNRERLIAGLLCESLDSAGYFRGDIPSLASRLNTSENEIRGILKQLKNFEPSGLFAESLSECLKIQLTDCGRCDPAMQKLLDNLELLGERRFKELKRLCEVDDEDLASMIEDIKALNPKPAAEYNAGITSYVIPDVYVTRRKDGSYRVELNNQSLPRLLINHQYYSEVLSHSGKDQSARRYLKENLNSAGFLLRTMHQRATTILRVSEEIIRLQQDFFENGIEQLKPMSLRDIAYNLEMHESTVSRVTNRKYMHTPRGLFELKFFFSQAAGTYNGTEDTSTIAIKHKIKQLISTETPANILSDDQIAELLARDGIKIARRTVAKYREAQNIATSAVRKRQKRAPS